MSKQGRWPFSSSFGHWPAALAAESGAGRPGWSAKTRSVGLGLVIAVAAIALGGCSMPPRAVEASNPPVPTPISSDSPTIVIPTASPSEASEPSRSPSAYSEEAPGNITWTTQAGETRNVPIVPGLAAKLSADRTTITYLAQAGNEYGLVASVEAGNFKQEVFLKEYGVDVQIGGIALDGRVVAKLMKHKLDSISDPNKKITIPSPVAPSGRLDVSLYKETFPITGATNYPAVSFKYKGTARVGNIVSVNRGVDCLTTSSSPRWYCLVNRNFVNGAPKMNTLMTFGPNPDNKTDFNTTTESNLAIGGKVLDASDEVNVIVGTTSRTEEFTPLTQENLLNMSGSLVLLSVTA